MAFYSTVFSLSWLFCETASKRRERAIDSGQLTLFESVKKKRKADRAGCKPALNHWPTKDTMPFRIVERPLMNTAAPKYKHNSVIAFPMFGRFRDNIILINSFCVVKI